MWSYFTLLIIGDGSHFVKTSPKLRNGGVGSLGSPTAPALRAGAEAEARGAGRASETVILIARKMETPQLKDL